MTNKKEVGDKSKNDKEELAFRRELVQQLAESFFMQGLISEKDFEDKKKLLKKMKRLIPIKDGELHFTIIYQDSLLEKGKEAVANEDFNLAYMFYATYFEHFVNEIIQIQFYKKKISNLDYKQLVRKVGIEDKFTWILKVLELPTFNENHLKTIRSFSEKRNSFVHYKYQSEPADQPIDRDLVQWRKEEQLLKKALSYSRSYRTRILYGGKKSLHTIF